MSPPFATPPCRFRHAAYAAPFSSFLSLFSFIDAAKRTSTQHAILPLLMLMLIFAMPFHFSLFLPLLIIADAAAMMPLDFRFRYFIADCC